MAALSVRSLRIHDIDHSDYGEYKCVASNPLGVDQQVMYLYGKPSTSSTCHLVCMCVCMYESICNAPLLQLLRVRARRPNRKDVSLACYRKVPVSMLDHEVTVAESSTVLEHKQQSCVVQNW